MFSANDARQKTDEVLKKCLECELTDVESRIIENINKGDTQVNIGRRLNSKTQEKLKELGYEVKILDEGRFAITIISWK